MVNIFDNGTVCILFILLYTKDIVPMYTMYTVSIVQACILDLSSGSLLLLNWYEQIYYKKVLQKQIYKIQKKRKYYKNKSYQNKMMKCNQ